MSNPCYPEEFNTLAANGVTKKQLSVLDGS